MGAFFIGGKMKVCINAGHAPNGIPDPGAVGFGYKESDIAYKAAVLVKHYLTCAGVQCILVQDDDLQAICDASNNFGADLFISLHCNAFNGQARGTETLYKSFNGQRLANCIQSQIIRSVNTVDRGVKERQNLYVLNATNAIAVLVEMAFIDNADDIKLLTEQLDTIARAIARGATDFNVS